MTSGELARHRFRAFGTDVEVVLWHEPLDEFARVAADVEQFALRWDAVFSRFRPDSQLSTISRSTGQWVAVSSDFLDVLDLAVDGYRSTRGRFDPTILPALERAGYDRPFDCIGASADSDHHTEPESARIDATIDDIEIDRRSASVRVPTGLRLDFGGIAKGAFVDRVADRLCSTRGGIVDAGGDMRLWGVPGSDSAWIVGVQHPGLLDQDVTQIHLPPGSTYALATSSTQTRSWQRFGVPKTHLIDPKTQDCLQLGLPNVTVIHSSVGGAEILTKSILVSIARGELLHVDGASLVLLAWSDGRVERITSDAIAA